MRKNKLKKYKILYYRIMDENFKSIIDPETNKRVPINSAIGTQIIKNYLECVKNGPDSKNIISTKMMYKKSGGSSSKTTNDKQDKQDKIYKIAKSLSSSQYEKSKIYQKEKQKGSIRGGSLIYIQRSQNKKWQKAVISETCKKGGKYFVNALINCDGKIGKKKAIPLENIIIA